MNNCSWAVNLAAIVLCALRARTANYAKLLMFFIA